MRAHRRQPDSTDLCSQVWKEGIPNLHKIVVLAGRMEVLQRLFAWWLGTATSNNAYPYYCDIFMAPSKFGWGVFAARDFEASEVVELAPLYLPMDDMAPVVKNSVLDDYIYGMRHENKTVGAVSLGMVMFYNHGHEPNVQWTENLGRGVTAPSDPESANAVGFVAKREISQGEELFSSYGVADQWFAQRRIDMVVPAEDEFKIAPEEKLNQYKREYCSKMYAGVDAPTAIAKVSIKAGERIEIAPALVLSKDAVKGTAIAPLVFAWEDWSTEQQKALQKLREAGQLRMQFQSPDTEWRRIDRFDRFENVVVFPAAGSIGLIKRVGKDQPNCGIRIKSSRSEGDGSAGLVMEVFALTDLEARDTLRLNVPFSSKTLQGDVAFLEDLLKSTGQLVLDSFIESKQSKDDDEL